MTLAESADDDELLLRIAQEDASAYRALVERHLDRILKVAERVLGNRQDAEDIVQEACLKIWNEAKRWKPKAKFSTWLYRVVLNGCFDHRRRASLFVVRDDFDAVPDEKAGADENMIAAEQGRRVREALERLPERQRAAIVLSYYEGLSNQEAAEAMDLLLGAFQQLLFRAKQKLKDDLLEGGHYENV